MNTYFNTLVTKLDFWCQHAIPLLKDGAELYCDYPPTKDKIWYHLVTPTKHESTTQEMLEILCHAFSALLS